MLRVSTIIPAYNSATTIESALESVLAQTMPCTEIIVVDDGSSDDTVSIVERYGSSIAPEHELRLVKTTRNMGPAGARNRGIAESTGDWLAFLDADDAWLPARLLSGVNVVENGTDVAMVCGRTMPFEAVGDDQDEPGTAGHSDLGIGEFAVGNPVATSTVIVRKDVVESVGGFDERFRGPEDYDLWMRIAKGHRIVKTSAVMARYRETGCGLSMNDRTFLPEVMRVLDKAFSPGGALADSPEMRAVASSCQYWNAAWMAFNRGSRGEALAHLLKSYRLNFRARGTVRRRWLHVLVRYLVGGTPCGGGCCGVGAKEEEV